MTPQNFSYAHGKIDILWLNFIAEVNFTFLAVEMAMTMTPRPGVFNVIIDVIIDSTFTILS